MDTRMKRAHTFLHPVWKHYIDDERRALPLTERPAGELEGKGGTAKKAGQYESRTRDLGVNSQSISTTL